MQIRNPNVYQHMDLVARGEKSGGSQRVWFPGLPLAG